MLDNTKTFINFFEAMADKSPLSTIISTSSGRSLSYEATNDRANQIARYLQIKGIKFEDADVWKYQKKINPESIVGILLRKDDPNWVISLLATLKVGATVVLLEADEYGLQKANSLTGEYEKILALNRQEIKARLIATGCKTIISDKMIASTFLPNLQHEEHTNIILLESVTNEITCLSKNNLDYHPALHTAAYFAFSSGTTGPPKAALFEHKTLSLRTIDHQASLQLTQEDCICQFSKIRFTDPTLMQVTLALSIGARLQLTTADIIGSNQLDKQFNAWGITMTIMTPTTMKYYSPTKFISLNKIISTGERGDKNEFKRWIQQGKKVFNGYGPMECGIGTSLHDLEQDISESYHDISIGGEGAKFQGLQFQFKQPIYAGVQEDDAQQSAKHESLLELYAAGEGIARGYVVDGHYNENSSQEAFYYFNDHTWYKTGDLFKVHPSGQNAKFYYMGRVDRQLQIGGVRIEPAIVETKLLAQLADMGVQDIYIASEKIGESTELRLAAFILPSESAELNQFTLDNITQRIQFSANFTAEQPTWYYLIDRSVDLRSCREKRKTLKEIGSENIRLIQPTDNNFQARYAVESNIQQLWQSVLQYPKEIKVGLFQNFEQIGGSSMLKVLLQSKIKEEYDIFIREGDFPGELTIANLARHIFLIQFFSKNIKLANKPEHKINPLFILPPIDMGNNETEMLSALLPKTIACYCLSLPSSGEEIALYHNPEIVGDVSKNLKIQAYYIMLAIKKIKPFGPYHLAGWSYGGMLAYQTMQLLQKNKNIVTAQIIDAPAPSVAQQFTPDSFLQRFKKIMSSLSKFTHLIPSEIKFSIHEPFLSIKDTAEYLNHLILEQTQPNTRRRTILNTVLNNLIALTNYKTEKIEQEAVTFFHAEESHKGDWEKVCNASTHIYLPTSHFQALQSEILHNTITQSLKASTYNKTALLFRLPSRNKHFVGRSELLDHMAHSSQARQSNIVTLVLVGMGGIGKTQLIIEYAHKQAEHYQFCAYIQCDRPITAQFKNLAQLLGIADLNTLASDALVNEVYNTLKFYKKTLFLFDNVENHDSIKPFLPIPQKNDFPIDILITTQDRHWMSGSEILEINTFSTDESMELFREFLLLSDTELATVRALSQDLEHLPLAIEQAARYIEKYLPTNKDRFQKYRHLLMTASQTAFKDGNLLGYDKTVLSVFKLALEKVKAESSRAFNTIQACAYLNPDTIPIELISKVASYEDLQLLQKLSLLRQQGDICSIHRLVQLVLRLEISDPCHVATIKQNILNEIKVFDKYMGQYSFFILNEDSTRIYKELKEKHASNTVNREVINDVFNILSIMLTDCLKDLEKQRLLNLFLEYNNIAETVFNWCKNIFMHYMLNEEILLALSNFYFSFASRINAISQNYNIAATHYQHAIDILEKMKEYSIGDLGYKLMQLGESLRNAGKSKEAINNLNRAASCFEQAEGDTLKVKLMAFRYRAAAYIRTNQADLAIRDLNDYLKHFSSDNPSDYNPILWASIHLGDAYRIQGLIDKALQSYQKGLEFSYKDYAHKATLKGETNSRDHINHLWPLYRLALGLISNKEYTTALQYAKEANRLAVLNLQDGDYDTALSYEQIADIYFKKGEYDLAIEPALLSLKNYAYPHHDRSNLSSACDLLSKIYLVKKNHETAEHFTQLKTTRLTVIMRDVEDRLEEFHCDLPSDAVTKRPCVV